MNINLSGLGWIEDCQPIGNRLRWTCPFLADFKLGLPQKFIVERAYLEEKLWTPIPNAIAPDGVPVQGSYPAYPDSWWSGKQNIILNKFIKAYHFTSPVQAVCFTYRGPTTRMKIKNNNHTLIDRLVERGDFVYESYGRIDEIMFLAPTGVITMEGFSFLNLFEQKKLIWETIAIIDVASTLMGNVPLSVTAPRCGIQKSTIDEEWTKIDEKWTEICDLAQEALLSTPPIGPFAPINILTVPLSPRETLEFALNLRWQNACLAGFGFFDGPHKEFCKRDQIGNLLDSCPDQPVAYRVRTDPQVEAEITSNIVVCPPEKVGPLAVPGIPQYVNPEARLTCDGKIEATLRMEWSQHDFNAFGVEIEENVSASLLKDTPAETLFFEFHSSNPTNPPFSGSLERRFEVNWHDVTLKARARAIDGWDRRSEQTEWSGLTELVLCHEPFPPDLISAKYKNGSTTLEVQKYEPDDIIRVLMDQQPTQTKICFYHRDPTQPLKTAAVTIGDSVSDGSSYKVPFTPPARFDSTYFKGGTLISGQVRAEITQITMSEITFDLQVDATGTAPTIKAGDAMLYQNQKDPALWLQVPDEVFLKDLGSIVGFPELLPFPITKSDVLQYSARISFLDHLGPFGNIVSDFRIPAAPPPPPPFSVELQGVDFYDRTLVKVILTKPVGSGVLCKVWWALGDYSNQPDYSDQTDSFPDHAVAGSFGPQKALEGRILFDLLPLPLGSVVTPVTIGVQQVNASGGQSAFVVTKIDCR